MCIRDSYERELEAVTWDDVGFQKTGDYELTVIPVSYTHLPSRSSAIW